MRPTLHLRLAPGSLPVVRLHAAGPLVTLDEFRRLTADMPGDLTVASWTPDGYCRVLTATEQASDAVPGPVGTDPICEETAGVLLLDVTSDESDPVRPPRPAVSG